METAFFKTSQQKKNTNRCNLLSTTAADITVVWRTLLVHQCTDILFKITALLTKTKHYRTTETETLVTVKVYF